MARRPRSLFPPDFWAALQQEVRPPDIERAKALMAEAGLADGFSTTITSWSQYSFLSNAAVVLQEQLRQIGIEAELNLVENATMVEQVYTRQELRYCRNWRERLRRSEHAHPAEFQVGRERQLRQLLQPGGRRADRAGDRHHRSGGAGQDLPGDSDDPARGSSLDQSLRRQPVRGDEDQRQGLRPHPDWLEHRLPHNVDRGVIGLTG